MDRGDITVGGIVTNVRESMTKKGKPCGFVMLEDFEGSGEIALFGEAWGRWRGMFSIGASVYIKAQITQMYAGSNFYDFNISDIQYLQTVKDKRIEKLTIVIDSHKYPLRSSQTCVRNSQLIQARRMSMCSSTALKTVAALPCARKA